MCGLSCNSQPFARYARAKCANRVVYRYTQIEYTYTHPEWWVAEPPRAALRRVAEARTRVNHIYHGVTRTYDFYHFQAMGVAEAA